MSIPVSRAQSIRIISTFQYVDFWAKSHNHMDRVEFRIDGEPADIKTFQPRELSQDSELDLGYESSEGYVGCTIDMNGHIIAVTGDHTNMVNQFETYLAEN